MFSSKSLILSGQVYFVERDGLFSVLQNYLMLKLFLLFDRLACSFSVLVIDLFLVVWCFLCSFIFFPYFWCGTFDLNYC
jgi:hypothetical protein